MGVLGYLLENQIHKGSFVKYVVQFLLAKDGRTIAGKQTKYSQFRNLFTKFYRLIVFTTELKNKNYYGIQKNLLGKI